MSTQNFSNHTRMHPFFHYFIMPLSLVGIAAGLLHTFLASGPDRIVHASIAVAFFLLFCVAGLTRIYSLKVQDRVIRSEENFRHYLLTGKPLPASLRMGQIVALRFASDAEFPELAQRAVSENLSSKQIKSSIQQWRADTYRV
jgi:hypothetical protein